MGCISELVLDLLPLMPRRQAFPTENTAKSTQLTNFDSTLYYPLDFELSLHFFLTSDNEIHDV